jgi:uncharacterized protein YjbJ (UPF0337 family)
VIRLLVCHDSNNRTSIPYGEITMKVSTKDQAKGAFHKVTGTIKEVAGKLSDNPKLETTGKVEKAAGKVQEKIGQIEKVLGR